MDRLRGIEYFVEVAAHGSISSAASKLGVSPPAVSKLLKSLERHLGTELVRRSSMGVTLTADGETYLSRCLSALDELAHAEASFSSSRYGLQGTLTVGMPPNIGASCLAPFLNEFRNAHPQLKLHLRRAYRHADLALQGLDVLIALDWLDDDDLVAIRLAQTRLIVCASPAYWARRGIPASPQDLVSHDRLSYRSPEGAVLDQWTFERSGTRYVIPVAPRSVCDDQSWLIGDSLNGGGVMRAVDMTIQPLLASGALVPALVEWEMCEAPPVHLIYRAIHRRNEKVRAFSAFVREVFKRLDQHRLPRVNGSPVDASRPAWWPSTRRAQPRRSSD